MVSTLAKAVTPEGPGYTPATRIPLRFFRKRVTSTITHLIIRLRSEPCDTVVAHVFLGVLHVPISSGVLALPKTLNINQRSFPF
jgi:hypothetical protein